MLRHSLSLRKIASTEKVDASHAELRTLGDYQNYIDQAMLNRQDISKDPKLEYYYSYMNKLSPERKKEVLNYARGGAPASGSTGYTGPSAYWDRVMYGNNALTANNANEDVAFSNYVDGIKSMESKVWEAEQGVKGNKRMQRRLRNMERQQNRRNEFNRRNWLSAYDLLDAENQSRIDAGHGVRATWNPATWFPAWKHGWYEIGQSAKDMFKPWFRD